MKIQLGEESDLVDINFILTLLRIEIGDLLDLVRVGVFRPVVSVNVEAIWRRLPSFLTEALYGSSESDISNQFKLPPVNSFDVVNLYSNSLSDEYIDYSRGLTKKFDDSKKILRMESSLDFCYRTPELAKPWQSDFFNFMGRLVYIHPNCFASAVNVSSGVSIPVGRIIPVDPYRRVMCDHASNLYSALYKNFSVSAGTISVGNRFGTFSSAFRDVYPVFLCNLEMLRSLIGRIDYPFPVTLLHAALKLSLFDEYYRYLFKFELIEKSFDFVDNKLAECPLDIHNAEDLISISDASDQWIFAGIDRHVFRINSDSIFFYRSDLLRYFEAVERYGVAASKRDRKFLSNNRTYRYMTAISVLAELSAVRHQLSSPKKDSVFNNIPVEHKKMVVAALDDSVRHALAKLNRRAYYRNLIHPNALDLDNEIVRYYRKFQEWKMALEEDFPIDDIDPDEKKSFVKKK